MSFLVDANVVVYSVTAGPHRDPCLELLEGIAAGELAGLSTVAVAEEVWHLELSGRIPELSGQTNRMRRVFFPLLGVTDATLDRALAFDADDELIGANDRLHAASSLEHASGRIVSADRGFDELAEVTRIDPLDPDLISRLRST